MMQAVAEFVAKRDDIVVGEKRGPPARGAHEIRVEEGRRPSRYAREIEPVAAFVHPGAAALAGTRVKVEIQAPDAPPGGVGECPHPHILVPDGRAPLGAEMQAVELAAELAQPRKHPLQRQVALDRFLVQPVAMSAQLLGIIGNVRCFERPCKPGLRGEVRELR
jgi:hypothetical protein